MSVEVRTATAADVEALVEFNHAMAAESEDRPLDLSRLRAGIVHVLAEPRDGFYLVAWEGDERLGALLVTYEWVDRGRRDK